MSDFSLEQWQQELPAALGAFVSRITEVKDIDFTYGLLVAALLWPVRERVQAFDNAAIQAVRTIATTNATVLLRVIQNLDDDHLVAARTLAEAASAKAEVRAALDSLLGHFEALQRFAEQLSRLYRRQPGTTDYQIDQIKAALVNAGGITNIQSLTIQLDQADNRSNPTEAPLQIPPPDPLPQVVGFVGRAQELAAFAQQLAEHQVAVITGFPGVGKTALATQLARQVSGALPIFWYTCQRGDGVLTLVWKLAAFLAVHGQPQVWQTLTRLDKTGQLPALNLLLDYLFQSDAKVGYLCCLDDLHHLASDPKYENLLNELRQVVQGRQVQLILVSQQTIRFDPTVNAPALTGLNLADTQALLRQQGITLEEVLLERLQERTAGNARLLIYAGQALKRIPEQATLIETLAATAEVQDFVLNLVDSTLNDDERAVMVSVAALLGWPGSADAIEKVSGQLKDRRVLAYLTARYLLQPWVIAQSTTYDLHDILRTFYYDLLGIEARLAMHRRAADYYTRNEKDSFKAALHACHAQEFDQAAALIGKDLRYHLHRGRAVALRRLLEQIIGGEPAQTWLPPLYLALGQVYTFLQMVQLARDSLTQALDLLQAQPATLERARRKAQVCRELGFLLREGAPSEALYWLRQGVEALGEADAAVAADLQLQLGVVQRRLGQNGAALAALERAQQLAPPGVNRLRLLTLLQLGNQAYYQHDLPQSQTYLQQALTQADKLGDPFNALAVRTNLAALHQTAGEWDKAAEFYAAAAKLAQALGNRQELAKLSLNWGVLQLHTGETEQALAKLQQALTLARQGETYFVVIAALGYLAAVHLQQGALAPALSSLTEAETLATERKIALQLPFIYTQQAQALLAKGDLGAALAYAERALLAAAEMPLEKAQALRVLGQIQAAQQQLSQAEASFAQSLTLLPHNPFETARTKAAWATVLAGVDAQERQTALCQEAERIFKKLGVQAALSAGG